MCPISLLRLSSFGGKPSYFKFTIIKNICLFASVITKQKLQHISLLYTKLRRAVAEFHNIQFCVLGCLRSLFWESLSLILIHIFDFMPLGWQWTWLSQDICQMEVTTQKTSFKSENIQADEVARRSREFDESPQVC